MRVFQKFVLLAFIVAILSISRAGAQEVSPGILVITEDIDTQSFPEISVTFSYADQYGNAVADVKAEEVEIRFDEGPVISSTKTLEIVQRPIVIAIVADFSQAMKGQSTPRRDRLRDMLEQIRTLLTQLPAETEITVIAFANDAEVIFPLRADGGGAYNALNERSQKPLPETSENYALTEAVGLALEQLSTKSSNPSALFVFASGMPEQTLDQTMLKPGLDKLGSNRPAVTFIGLGDGGQNSETTLSGNPAALKEAATLLGGIFLPFFTSEVSEVQSLIKNLHERSIAVTGRRDQYKLTFNARDLSAGEHHLTLTIRGTSQTKALTVGAVPPQVTLRLSSPDLQGIVRLSALIDYTQAPIRQVEYILNNIPIGNSSSSPDFVIEFDTSTTNAQQLFPPGKEYQLFVAATDGNGLSSRSKPVTIRMLPPPHISFSELVWQEIRKPHIAGLSVTVLVLVSIVTWLRVTPRGREIVQTITERATQTGRKGSLLDQNTLRNDQVVQGVTERYPEPTSMSRLRVEWFDGQKPFSKTITERQATIGRTSDNLIQINHPRVSALHARLTILHEGFQITDLGSTNGTFIGEQRQHRLTPNHPEMVQMSDTIWIGPDVRMSICDDQA